MTYLGLTGLINFVACASLGFFVLVQDRKNTQNISYFFLNASVAIFSLGYFLWQSVFVVDPRVWFKVLVVGIILINQAYLFFVFTFLRSLRTHRVPLALCSIANVFFVFASARGWFFVRFVEKFGLGLWPEPTRLFDVYLTFWVAQCLYGFFFLLKNLNKGDLRRKLQVRYFTIAAIVGFLGGATNWPVWYGYNIPPYGNILISLYIAIIAYAIVRHQLLDIKVIIKKTLVFAGLFMASYAVFASFAYLGSMFFENMVHNRWVAMLPSMIIVVLMLRPLESFLRTSTDKFLFQKKYDYKTLLKTFTDEVLTVLDMNDLVRTTVRKLCDIVKLENAAIFLRDGDKCHVAASIGIDEDVYDIDMGECILEYFRVGKSYILVTDSDDEHSLENEVRIAVSRFKARLVIPFMHHNILLGMLLLGPKKSDEDFSQDDIDILLPLARTLSIAIANAQLFEKLSESQAQAAQREKMAVIGTLSAGINHEICNPLGIARGQCEMFLLNLKEGVYTDKTDAELLGKAAEIMDKVIHETDRATVITRKLSSFAKPAKGYAEENVRVEAELKEVVSLVEHDLSLDNINIVEDIAEDIPAINADKKQLQEIFFNIVRNAAQSIKTDGTITLRAFYSDDKVVVQVQDTGEGISKENLDRIFAPFFTTKDPGKGTGLGLFIVKQIVGKNNGRIYVQSDPGKGTIFTIEFFSISDGGSSREAEEHLKHQLVDSRDEHE